jgi:superfamily II DNA or RNA helicase
MAYYLIDSLRAEQESKMNKLRRTDLVHLSGRKEAGDHLYVVKKVEEDEFTGVAKVSVHPLLPRLFVGRDAAPAAHDSLLPEEIQRLPSPAEALAGALPLRQEAWPTRTRQSIERLFVLWLLHEDRKNLLDAANVDQLAHQVSLLEYVKQQDLRRLLIADEVGLGKTIEAGMLMQWVLEANPSARILYLAPAMLVDNVYSELKRMEVSPRIDRYSATVSTISNDSLREAQVIIASIHRAAYEPNRKAWQESSGAWDLIIVDECHHVSDWSEDGSGPKVQMRLVRELVEKRLKPEGRLVLMSATPHQGNENKFRNLLRLLSDEGYRDAAGSLASVAGRVVYRTKEDVRDWDNQPLFSKRRVNEPTFVQLGDDYHAWMRSIEGIFVDANIGPAAWRKAQALQWAASSPKAGLAYLARLALRCGLDFDRDRILYDAAAELRPYRGLPADAPLDAVRSLLEKQAGKHQTEDDEEELFIESPIDPTRLREALAGGIQLVRSGAMQTKLAPLLQWVTDEAPAKFVVFASPIETVDEVRLGLSRLLGDNAVVTITGGMKPYERRTQMEAFRAEGVQVLVASKAGSEGINLQVSHRLIHFDVPWNPMEMEQRVGRVHRYGSTHTVVVDTLVVENSREARMLRRCRARLAQIVEQLFGPKEASAKFDEMYARVMTQVSGEELAALMAEEGFLTRSAEKLEDLVQAGFEGWQASDKALRSGAAAKVREIPGRGEAREEDVERLFELLGAQRESGWCHVRLIERDGERVEETEPARVWVFPGEGTNVRRTADRASSLSVRGPNGFRGGVDRVGLNLPAISSKMRELVGGAHLELARSPRAVSFLDGAGVARLPEPDWSDWLRSCSLGTPEWQSGAVLLAWTVRLLHRGKPLQTWSGVQAWIAKPNLSDGRWLSGAESAQLFRILWRHRQGQNLHLPPHKRAASSAFSLNNLREISLDLTRGALNSVSEFDSNKNDYEIVPIAALTIEPRGDNTSPDLEEINAADDTFEVIDTTYRPSADFLERVLTTVSRISSARSHGEYAVYVLLFVEPSRLKSSDPHEHGLAFGVYIGMTKQDVLVRYQQHRDPNALLRASSFTWQAVLPVGIFRLDDRFRGLSHEAAMVLERDLADAFKKQGLRVLGGH